jgi:hypothetical protein
MEHNHCKDAKDFNIMRLKQQYVFSHFRLDASTMPITPKRLAVHVKKMMDIMYRSQTLSVESTIDGYQNRPELLRFVAHSKQCRLADTTAQVPHTFLPQSLQAKGLLSTAPPMSMSMSTSMLSGTLCNGVSQSSQCCSWASICCRCVWYEKMGC